MSVYDRLCEVCGMPAGYACVEIGTENTTLRDKPHLRRRRPDYGSPEAPPPDPRMAVRACCGDTHWGPEPVDYPCPEVSAKGH